MIVIQNYVKVVDSHGGRLEPTYLKRARQLVKNGRATWASPDTICLVHNSKKEKIMEHFSTEIPYTGAPNENTPLPSKSMSASHSVPKTPKAEDKKILDLAKRRLAAKRNLTSQIFDFFLLIIFSLAMIGVYDQDERSVYVVLFCSFWLIRLIVRIIRFLKPSFKDGIAAYFRERRERKLEAEYNRLKKITDDSLFEELV